MRQKFIDIDPANASPIAEAALDRIGVLYVIEKDIRGKSPKLRQKRKLSRAELLLTGIKNWLPATLATHKAKPDLAIAIRYV